MALEERGERTCLNSISALQRKDINNLNAVLNAGNFHKKVCKPALKRGTEILYLSGSGSRTLDPCAVKQFIKLKKTV
jgi:hypothetical protein